MIDEGLSITMKDRTKRENLIWLLAVLTLLGLSAVAVVRSLIIGLDIDEQYAVTLAYRIARGDILVKEVWEPHQTSALLPALLTKLFLLCKGNSEYLVLYLRGVGVLCQLAVSVSWFCVIRKIYGDKVGFLSALIVFHTLPKGIVTPEFANQQIWLLLMVVPVCSAIQQDVEKTLLRGGGTFYGARGAGLPFLCSALSYLFGRIMETGK